MGRPTRLGPGGVLAFLLAVALLVGCSSEEGLSAEDRLQAAVLVDERAALAMIELSEEDRSCAVDRLSPDDLEELEGEQPDLTTAAEAVVDCVGEDLIAASVLRSQAGAAAPASLDCAVGELGLQFVIELVAGAMAEEPPQVQAEIEVARALGVCLELDELLQQ